MACGCKGKKLSAPPAGEGYYALETPDGGVETFADLADARAAKASKGGTVKIVRGV